MKAIVLADWLLLLAEAVCLAQTAAGMSPITMTNIAELRAALAPVFTAKGLPPPSYTDATIVAGATVIKRVHVTELRTAVRSVE